MHAATILLTSIVFGYTTFVAGDLLNDQSGLQGSERRQCAELIKLEGIVNLVNDADAFAQFESRHNLTQSELDDIKAKAVAEAERLKSLQANTTLMQQCAAVDAGRLLRAECRAMRRLEEVVKLAENQTALQEFRSTHGLPDEWLTALVEKATNATARLEQMKLNTTLVTACDADVQAQVEASTNSKSSQGIIAEAKASTHTSSAVSGFMLVAALTAALWAGW